MISDAEVCCGQVPVLSPEGTIETARELGEISRSANVPASFQPILTNPADPLRRDIIQVLEEESSAGARVWVSRQDIAGIWGCILLKTPAISLLTGPVHAEGFQHELPAERDLDAADGHARVE